MTRPARSGLADQVHRHTKRQCEQALQAAMPNHAQAADGTKWTCSCGRRYVHVCDEAEGCGWEPIG